MNSKLETRNSKLPLLIGLSGKAGSGKSTAAAYLCDCYGYHEFAFAGALKEVAGLVFGFTTEQLHGDLKEAVDERWGVTPRWCLQWLGTEVLKAKWPDIWVRALRREIMDFLGTNGERRIVVSDVRFADEAAALKRMGAKLWRLERPGFIRPAGGDACPTAAHSSETALDDYRRWDAVIENNGNLAELCQQLDTLLH